MKKQLQLLLLLLLSLPGFARAQGNTIGYQGVLNDGGLPATGLYDFIFSLFDVEADGAALAPAVVLDAIPVTNGVFQVPLDFGPGVFTGPARWLEIAVRQSGVGEHAVLVPRSTMLPAPYSIFAGQAGGLASGALTAEHLNTGGLPPEPALRLQQVHQGIPIVAAEALVQLNAQGGVECIVGDLATETSSLDDGRVPLIPQLSARAAADRARAHFGGQPPAALIETTMPELAIFDPAVLDETGNQALVWDLEAFSARRSEFHFRVLVNAANGQVARLWTLNPDLLNREISDKNNNATTAAVIVRTEGQASSGVTEADNAYRFLEETYNFYFTHHRRDSYDNAGAKLQVTVRFCDTNNPCPWFNASAGIPMIFGDGFIADDAVAHEYTHNVTARESKLIYLNVSGAINESFSDVWGEFVDLSNGGPADSAAVRWDIGEDTRIGRQRSMKDPTLFGHPDRLHSPLYQQPSDTNDWGGVHHNSGVNNKLCYLLTDGDNFNGQSISGLGITKVAALYYEAQINLLTAGASWADLYNALRQSAVNVGWSTAERNNLHRACLAVELVTEADGQDVYVDRSSGCPIPAGYRGCELNYGPYKSVAQGVSGANPGDVLQIRTGTYHEPMTIAKFLTLQAENGSVTIGN